MFHRPFKKNNLLWKQILLGAPSTFNVRKGSAFVSPSYFSAMKIEAQIPALHMLGPIALIWIKNRLLTFPYTLMGSS